MENAEAVLRTAFNPKGENRYSKTKDRWLVIKDIECRVICNYCILKINSLIKSWSGNFTKEEWKSSFIMQVFRSKLKLEFY